MFSKQPSVFLPIKKLFQYYLFFITVFFLGRTFLFIQYYDRIEASGVNYWLSFVYGLKMDTMMACFILALPTVVLFTFPKFLAGFAQWFLKLFFLVFILVVVYMENATIPFFAQFDARPNELFINYIKYPKEVLTMLYKAYLFEIVLAFIMMFIVAKFYLAYMKEYFKEAFEVAWWKRLLLFPIVAALVFIGIRSSFGHRAANLSSVVYSKSHLVNEIAKNSLYSVLYTVYSLKAHGTDIKKYGKMQESEAYKRVQKRLSIENVHATIPFLRTEPTHFPTTKKKNIVVFMQESIGAQFVEVTGGEAGITPHINSLSKEGLLFENLHSVGTRSVRGLAGTIAGFIPVPGRGVIKRSKGNPNFFTLANLLKPYGYSTSFIYGGEKDFDNMGAWFYGNGFDLVIDEKDYKNPAFKGTWGASDEDLVRKANELFKKQYAEGKPFASVMFSSSNHTPFEFPDGRIELVPNVPKQSVKNAIKYADYAIGLFFELAKKEAYFKDTIFVVASDHNVRVYGKDLVPVKAFHIPAFIIADGLKPQVFSEITSQPDVLATAIDLLGVDLVHPVLGKSVYSNEKQNFAFMQFHEIYALRDGDKVAILQPNKKPLTFHYANAKLTPTEHDSELEKDLLAFVTVSSLLYENRLHTLEHLRK